MYTNEFSHAGSIYNLDRVRQLVRGEKAFYLPTKSLTWVLAYDKPDKARVKAAKHRYPLLVTKWKGKWTIIDGLHRLERYRRKGIGVVPVKLVTTEMLAKAKIKR